MEESLCWWLVMLSHWGCDLPSVLCCPEWAGDRVKTARCWRSRRRRASGSCTASCCSSSTPTSTSTGQKPLLIPPVIKIWNHYVWREFKTKPLGFSAVSCLMVTFFELPADQSFLQSCRHLLGLRQFVATVMDHDTKFWLMLYPNTYSEKSPITENILEWNVLVSNKICLLAAALNSVMRQYLTSAQYRR